MMSKQKRLTSFFSSPKVATSEVQEAESIKANPPVEDNSTSLSKCSKKDQLVFQNAWRMKHG